MPTKENATTTYVKKLRLFSRDVRLYLISSTLVGLCWIGIYGVLFNLYLFRLGYDLAFVGLINATIALAYACLSLPASAIGERWSIRRTMILGYCLVVVGLVLPPLAQFTPYQRRGLGKAAMVEGLRRVKRLGAKFSGTEEADRGVAKNALGQLPKMNRRRLQHRCRLTTPL